MITTEIDRWASAMHQLRPDWRHDSLRTFATNNLAHRPYRDACIAGAWIATDPTTRTPNLLKIDGPWWAACAQTTQQKPTEPGIVTRCEHGETGTRCQTCYPPRNPKPCAPELIAQIRATIRANRPTEGPNPMSRATEDQTP